MGKLLRVSKGTFINYVNRMVPLILKHKNDTVFWPESDKREEIKEQIKNKYGFPNCLGYIDGTLLPLETKPRHYGEEYFCRKSCYAIGCVITCDDAGRVRDYLIGWPGSVHDNRMWQSTSLYQDHKSYFQKRNTSLATRHFHLVVFWYRLTRSQKPQGCILHICFSMLV
jgi:hypothetical protein